MADSVFVVGQRWVSNTESELGLGIVVEFADRRVSVSFPAAGERRVYASDNAPLSRVMYEIGETVTHENGSSLEITERHEVNGCIIYIGNDANGESAVLPELDLDSFVQFSRPLDRLFAGQIDKNASFLLRTESLAHQHRHAKSGAFGLTGPRVQLLPHQFYIAKQVSARHHPRVLLADEVGLGKTIEAGLILHQQLLSGSVNRVLIVVPDSLIHQWLVEMLRRFNLHFTILDEQTCAAIEEFDDEDDPDDEIENPFETAQLVLAGLSLLVDQPERQAQALAASWDLMVVDEAHHLSWNETQASPAYDAIEALARHVAGLILITATPEQLGIEGHFARLRLLDPDRYHSLSSFRAEEENYRPIADIVHKLLEPNAATSFPDDRELQGSLAAFLGANEVAEIAAAKITERGELLSKAIQNLLDRHGTGRVLYRNCRDAVPGFPERQLHSHALAAPGAYLAKVEAASTIELLNPELLLGESWLASDPRVAWLEQWLIENRPAKTLVICALAATAVALEEHLSVRCGIRSAAFHEGLGLVARDRAAAYFADEQENAEVLVCSEIGSEGRNFQFAHRLVLFDLPLNPDLLEQRIGRLDRIGQRHAVQIHVPYFLGTASEVLLNWYHRGLDSIEHVFPAGRVLYHEFESSLEDRLRDPSDVAAADKLIEDTRVAALAAREALKLGRDRLVELNSHDPVVARSVIAEVNESTRKLELADYMDRVFDFFGVDQQVHGLLSVVVHPGDHMMAHNFPSLPEGGITGTYDRVEALAKEDMQFLTWEHPMVTGALDMMISGEFGNATLCSMKAPFLKPGTLILEALFVVSCPAPKRLQVQRYIPQGTIRIVVDRENKNLTSILTPERLNPMVEALKRRVAHEVAKHARSEINAMANNASKFADAEFAPLLAATKQEAQNEQQAALERLQALAAVNPNIRAEEIDYQKESARELLEHLEHTQLKLDAVRVVLTT
ncbi:MAG: ATP-dependent helicase HepA [Gammaproteobacteria bacterium]